MIIKKRGYIILFSIMLMFISSVFFMPLSNLQNLVYADNTVTDTWDGISIDTNFEGSGTAEEPYLISTAAEFIGFAGLINSGNTTYNNANVFYLLDTNINLNNKIIDGIGTGEHQFLAHFDGNNCAVSNFKRSVPQDAQSAAGLFNFVRGGSVKNLSISSATIQAREYYGDSAGQFSYSLFVGVVCGQLDGLGATIENVTVSSSKITINLYNNFSEVDVGGIAGRCIDNANLNNCSVESTAITVTYKTSSADLGGTHIGMVAGTVQTDSNLSYCHSTNDNSIIFEQQSLSASALGKNRFGGIVGLMAVRSTLKLSFSSFYNATLTTKEDASNAIGGLCGEVKDSEIQNCYAKNDLFAGDVEPNPNRTNYAGGLIGYAAMTSLALNATLQKTFTDCCYIVASNQEGTSFGNALYGAVVGQIDVADDVASAYKNVATLKNTYYIAKNGQTLTDYNISTNTKYASANQDEIITKSLSNANAKSLQNYANFNEDYWTNDLATPTNEGYPILIGVGNNLVPVVKNTYTITIVGKTIDENGETEQLLDEIPIIEDESKNYQVIKPENHTITGIVSTNEKVTFSFDEQTNLLTLSNPTEADTITITFTKNSYTVTLAVANSVGGTLSFAAGYSNKVFHGTGTQVNVSASDGYRFNFATGVTLSVTGLSAVQTENGFKVDGITGDLTITVTFTQQFSVTICVSDNAVAEISIDQTTYQNEITTTLDAGQNLTIYQRFKQNKELTNIFAGWQVNSAQTLQTTEQLTISNINQNYTIVAVYEIKYYTLDVSITEESANSGTVSINGSQVTNNQQIGQLTYNQTISIQFSAASTSYVSSVTANEVQLTQAQIDGGSYSFNLTNSASVAISFENYRTVSLTALSNTLQDKEDFSQTVIGNFVGFQANGMTSSATYNFKKDESVSAIATPKYDYIFAGWFADADLTNEVSQLPTYEFSVADSTNLYAKFTIVSYEVTFVEQLIDENGISSRTLMTQTVSHNGSAALMYEIPQYYEYKRINPNENTSYENGIIQVTNVTEQQTITIISEKIKYTISLQSNSGGSVIFKDGYILDTSISVYIGQGADILVSPDSKYRYDVVVSDGCDYVVQQNTIKITNVQQNITVNVTFIKTYNIKVTTSHNDIGQISFDNATFSNEIEQTFDEGQSVTIYQKVVDEQVSAYEFKRWTNSQHTELSADETYQIATVNKDFDIIAVFAKIGYSLTVKITQQSTATSNTVTVNGGAISNETISQTRIFDGQDYNSHFEIYYNTHAGSYIKKIDLNGVEQTITEEKFEFDLFANTLIEFYFAPYEFEINLSATNGTLKFDDGQTHKTVTYYDTADVFVVADEGYQFDGLSGDTNLFSQTQVDQNGKITLSGFVVLNNQQTTNISINALFSKIKIKLTINYGNKGAVLVNGETPNSSGDMFEWGDLIVIQFTPNSNCYLNSVFVNGRDCTSDLTSSGDSFEYTIESLIEETTIDADFGLQKYSFAIDIDFADVTYELYVNGALTSETYFEYGSYLEVILSLPQGYSFNGYFKQDKVTQLPSGATFGFNITENTHIYAKILTQVVLEPADNGYVTANGLTSSDWYEYGDVVTIDAYPNLGYKLQQYENLTLSADNTITVTSYTLVKAIFVSKPVTVTLSASEHGKIDSHLNGDDYQIGDVLRFNAEATTIGYHFVDYTGVFAGELSNEPSTLYTILPQDAENGIVEICANFAIDTFEVEITNNYGGQVKPFGTATYDYGTTLDLKIEIYNCYELGQVLVNGEDQSSNVVVDTFTIIIKQNTAINFEFKPLLWWDVAEMPSGKGTTKEPYLITNANELAFISYSINNNISSMSGKTSYAHAYYLIVENIDMAGRYWTPIGTTENPFNGTFDFNYLKINNLAVIDDITIYQYGGLFDVIGPHGKIINQFRSYTKLLLFIAGGTVLVTLLITFVIFFEKRRRKPKRVIVLPSSIKTSGIGVDTIKKINKPNISKIKK